MRWGGQGTTVVHGHAGCFKLNGKVERLFRTLKIWQRISLLAFNTRSIQRKLTTYRIWYNRRRPHGCLGVLTPDEKASSCKAPEVQAIRAAEEVEPVFKIARETSMAIRGCRSCGFEWNSAAVQHESANNPLAHYSTPVDLWVVRG